MNVYTNMTYTPVLCSPHLRSTLLMKMCTIHNTLWYFVFICMTITNIVSSSEFLVPSS